MSYLKYSLLVLILSAAALSGCCGRSTDSFPEFSEPYAITSGPHEHLLASYFAINSWSPDGRYVSVLETDINGRLVEEDEPAKICLVDLKNGNELKEISQTRCWNFQEAAMFHWLPDGNCLWNDLRDGKFVTVIHNLETGEERTVPHPVSAVSKDGKWAVSINYARLRICRPDYGYPGPGQDAMKDDPWPDNDGLWLVNLETGEAKLLLSIAQARDLMTPVESEDGLGYFCHTIISPHAKRIFFLARTVGDFDRQIREKGHVHKWETTSFTVDLDGGNLRRCYPDGWAGSHFNWLDDETLTVTAKWNGGEVWSHTIFKVGEENQVRHVAPGIMDWDGHCIFTPGGKFLSSDGYWNKDGFRTWVLVRLSDDVIKPLGAYFVPKNYREGYSRCDLHPRYKEDGTQVAFNSVHEGSRQVYLRDIKW